MKIISLLVITILFFNCNKPKHEGYNYAKNKKQHLENVNIQKESTYLNEKDLVKENKEENTDVKIIKATILKNSYSDHKDIKIVFKNCGKKTIKAIKFEWSCINSLDEPANGKYFYGEGNYKETSTHLLKSGETRTEILEDFSTDASEITKIRAFLIIYTDGSKWKLHTDEKA